MIKQIILGLEILENRRLHSVTAPPNNSSTKPNPPVQATTFKYDWTWPPKLKNPPRIVVEKIIKPIVFDLNLNENNRYHSNIAHRYRWNFKFDKESNKVVLDDINPLQSYSLHNIDTLKNEYRQLIHSR